jgi:class 3 adenylate cyclase/tetratricopeptide (TPR) repeat protein
VRRDGRLTTDRDHAAAERDRRCPACGSDLPSSALDCPTCGEPILPSERKVVTVLFADLAGYTAMAETLDPEEVYGVVRPWMTDLRLVVEAHGGTVPQVMGDGFMAVFGVPTAHDDDAERGVHAALALVGQAERLARRRSEIRFPGLHVGVNTGEVIVAPSREASGFAVVGDPVNVAARLVGLAVAGQVLVGESTRSLTRHAVRYGPRTLQTAKGKKRPLPAFEARGVRATSGRQPTGLGSLAAARSPFVDRGAALRRLAAEASAVATSGRSRVVVIVDEPGLGKTRLADELRSRLPGWLYLHGACHPYGQRLPLAAIADAVATAIGLGPARWSAGARRKLRAFAAEATDASSDASVTSLTRHFETILGLHDAPAGGGEALRPGGLALDAGAAVEPVIRAIAAGRPTLVVLDDVQWADLDLLTLLGGVDHAPWSQSVLFLALARPEPEAWHRHLMTVHLGALPVTDARRVTESVLGGGVPAAVLRRLVARAAGNPLFLEESARMLVESRALVRGPRRWQVADPTAVERVPATLRLVVAARLDRLSRAAKRTLQDASVAGAVAWDALLVRMAVSGPGSTTEVSVHEALRELEDRDILRQRPTSRVPGAAELEFKHDVIRDVAYESLPRAERAARHRLIADWLRERVGDTAVAAIAHQYEQAWELARRAAGRPADHETASLAADYLRRWGDAVFAVQPRLAEALYVRGLAIADADPDAVDDDQLAWLLIGRAEGLGELGRHRDAIEVAQRALDLVASTSDTDTQGFALLALGRARSNLGEVAAARSLIERALVVFATTGNTLGAARGYHRLAESQRFDDFIGELRSYRRAYALYGRGRPERDLVAVDLAYLLTVAGGREARDWLARATRLVARSGDERGAASLRRAAAYDAWYRGDLDAAMRAARDARPQAAETGDRWVEVDTLLIEALVRSVAGPPAEAERLIRELLRIADSVGTRHLRALALAAGARPALRAGRPRQAARRTATARRILVELGVTMELAEVDMTTAAVQLDRGAWDDVLTVSASGEARAVTNGWRVLVPLGPLLRGRAYLGAGRLREARRELLRARRLAGPLQAVGLIATAEAALGQVAALAGATSAPEEPGRTPRRPGTMSTDRQTPARERPEVGPLTRREARAIEAETSGILALQAGEPASAAASFGRAVRAWHEQGLTIWQARAEGFRADALEAAGRRASARASRQRAEAILVALESPLRGTRV